MKLNIATRYMTSMRHHPYGVALYEPELASVVYPGACGYLNRECQWQPITDLNNNALLEDSGFPVPAALAEVKPRYHKWGPKQSAGVTAKKLGADLGTSGAPAGVPVEASVAFQFSSLLDFGALLMCPHRVLQVGYYHEDPFRQWAKENADKILKNQPDVRNQGFYVVTSTYSTDDVWVNAWDSQEHHTVIGFKVDGVGAGEIAPSGEFYRAESASGWTHAEAEDGDDKVMFFSGLEFKYRKLPFGRSSIKEVRGLAPVVIADPEDEKELYQLEWKTIGYGM